jgi:hypothetical protein
MSPSRAAALLLPLLLAASAPAAASAAAAKSKKKVPTDVTVTSVNPQRVVPGGSVTIKGSHLDEVTAVILDKDSPKITEQSPEKLVFMVPVRDENQFYTAPIYLVLSGRPLLTTRIQISVAPDAGESREKPSGAVALDETGALTAGKPKSWTVALDGATLIELSVSSKGGEVQARVEPAPEGEPPLERATYSGSLRWRLLARELGAREVKVSLSTDAAKTDYRILVRRSGGTVRPAPAPESSGAKN